ncbi:hypothetical protein [Aestuariivivens sp. NBU2969]|uniref:hypothetical protein n=1 Tax=Aestuariivivens sp. NBU2969 TaxID=2873267 RepID=UPI001CBAC57F|nr:hypothetical protein [Aestuariivivens sp. NBU2969]
MAWSKKFSSCQSCGTNEWNHLARGYCKKCYPLIKDLETIKCWDVNKNKTLITVRGVNPKPHINDSQFKKYQSNFINQIESRLGLYKLYNKSNVEGLDIEGCFKTIAEDYCTGSNKSSDFHGAVTKYDLKFNARQRKLIYKDLLLLRINRQFRVNHTQIYFDNY